MNTRPSRQSDLFCWVVAALLGGGSQLLWWMLFTPQPLPEALPAPEPPRMTYRPVLVQSEGRVAGDELHAVWSPILFSLPTHVGFSQSQLTRSGMMLPPAHIPVETSLPRPGMPDPATLAPIPPLFSIREQQQVSRKRRPPRPAPRPRAAITADPAPTDHPPYELVWLDGLKADDFEKTPFDLPPPDIALREAVIHLTINEEGFVQRALMDVASGSPAWDARAIRAIRAWRAQAGYARSGRVRVAMRPLLPEPAPNPPSRPPAS